MTDAGCEFYAVARGEDGRVTRETDDRRELLDWIDVRTRAGDVVIEVGMSAHEPRAIANMIAAMRLGAAKLHT